MCRIIRSCIIPDDIKTSEFDILTRALLRKWVEFRFENTKRRNCDKNVLLLFEHVFIRNFRSLTVREI